jgi:hypothetical protein
VPRRSENDHSRSCRQKHGDSIDKYEMTKMVGAELYFETIRGVSERRSRDAGISDNGVE